MYYYENDSLEYGKKLLREGIKDNPYIMFSESRLADIFDQERQKDSFEIYSKKAFKNLPNNPVHFVMYARGLVAENKIDSVLYHFDQIRNSAAADYQIWKIALGALVENSDSTLIEKKNMILSDFRKLDLQNAELSLLADYVEYGSVQVKLAIEVHEKGLNLFNQGLYDEAYALINESIELYTSKKLYENLIKAYYSNDELNELIEIYDIYSNTFNETNSITTSQYALSLIKVGKVKQACAVIQHLKKFTNISLPSDIISRCI